MHLWVISLPFGRSSYSIGSSSFILILSFKLYLNSHFLSEKDSDPLLGENGSISSLSVQVIFMNPPGLISFMFSTREKSPLILFLTMRLKFSLSQMKFVWSVKKINSEEISE